MVLSASIPCRLCLNMRRFTISAPKSKNCCEYVVNGIQYLLGIALVLGYFLFLPTIPYFALFAENYANIQIGEINHNEFHCTYHYIKIQLENTTNITMIEMYNDNEILSETRSDDAYWDIFIACCCISAIFGYWTVLFCPAFRLCLNNSFCNNYIGIKNRFSKLDCCSWKIWIITSIISLLFAFSALILVLERPCKNEVIDFYKDNNDDEHVDVSDTEIGYCLWFIITILILNTMIIFICIYMRNDDISQYKQSFHQITLMTGDDDNHNRNNKKESLKGCDNCNYKGYVHKWCCLKKQACPVCTCWEELDHFNY